MTPDFAEQDRPVSPPFTRFIAVALIVGFVGVGLLAIETRHGIGLGPDSFDYLSAANTLAEEGVLGRPTLRGSIRPLTHFPPVYSIVIGWLVQLGLSLEVAARYVNLLAFGGLVGLGSAILWQATGSWLAAGVGGFLLALSPNLLAVSSWAMSEPLFLSLGAATLMCFGVFLQRGRRGWLLAAAAAAGLASITRYAGVALILGCLLPVFADPRRSLSRKVRDGLLFTGAGLLPLGVWVLRNIAISGSAVDRVLAWHPPAWSEMKIGLRNILAWVMPEQVVDSWPATPRYVLGLILFVLLWLTIRRSFLHGRGQDEFLSPAVRGVSQAVAGTLAAYGLILLVTMTLVDRLTRLDVRILAPAHVLWLILSVAGLAAMAHSKRAGWRTLAIVAASLWAVAYALQAPHQVDELSRDGQGYASRTWQSSPTIEFVRDAAPAPIYTNDLGAVFLLTRRTAAFIPVAYNPATGGERADYPELLASMRTTLERDHGLLVLFGGDPLPLEPEILADLTNNLTLWARFPDGAVYGSDLVPSWKGRGPLTRLEGLDLSRLFGCPWPLENPCPLH